MVTSFTVLETSTALPDAWARRAAEHGARVGPWADAFVQRRACGEKHPVWDFLFTYYSFSPGKLMKWCPAIFEEEKSAEGCRSTLAWDWPKLADRDVKQAQWIAQLCENIADKPARFQCHGLHEWAMVYKQSAEQVRHSGYQLRLSPEQLAAFVESQAICCTHHDAFRFFTPEARPLNLVKPRLETRLDLEQGGCLHTNMDLYKWSYKLWPWIGSDLVADTFLFAVGARELDMRASPYDLAHLGFAPIALESESGREEYRAAQEDLARRAAPLRVRLREAALKLIECQRDDSARWDLSQRSKEAKKQRSKEAKMNESAKPQVGDVAPDFTAAVIADGMTAPETVTLSALRDKPVVLYFYPKDDTPGCTKQACDLRDAWAKLRKRAHLFGVSVDPVKRHGKFIQKFSLPFPLISDEDKRIVQAYGVWVEKMLYGKKYMGTERSTVVIGTDGRIRAVLEKVKPEEHLERLLDALP